MKGESSKLVGNEVGVGSRSVASVKFVEDVGGKRLPVRNQTYKVYFNNGNVVYVNMQDAFKLLEDTRVKAIELVYE